MHKLALLFMLLPLWLHAQNSMKSLKIYENRKLTQIALYNEAGKLTEKQMLLSSDPDIWFRETNTYQNGILLRSDHYIDNALMFSFEYFYNEKLMPERRRERRNDSVTALTIFDYQESDKLMIETHYGENNKHQVYTYSYNAAGLVTRRSESVSEPGVNMVLAEEYSYDKSGNMIQSVSLNDNDTISDIHYTYDALRRRTAQYVINHRDTMLSIIWTYRGNELNPSAETHFANGFVVRKTTFKYCSNGLKKRERIIEYRVFSGNMHPERTKRKFRYTWHKNVQNAGK